MANLKKSILLIGLAMVALSAVEAVQILPPNGDGESGVMVTGDSGVSYKEYFPEDQKGKSLKEATKKRDEIADALEAYLTA
jgi:hypothetical protein